MDGTAPAEVRGVRWRVVHGGCLEVMARMRSASVDAVVTDPPYGLSFMGKAWDHGVPGVPFWAEALRVAKPGAHLLAFGGTRTFHRLAVAIEDAGWEVRDCLSWLYGTGFPKSHNLPGGLGTALKPAWEPIIVARKPVIGTVARNVAEHGTGALNIDRCRIETSDVNPSIARRKGAINHLSDRPAAETEAEGRMSSRQSPEAYRKERTGEALGRWPANVTLDEDAAAVLDAQTGEMKSGVAVQRNGGGQRIGSERTYSGHDGGLVRPDAGFGDSGGASRFFYVAKASRSERNAGLEGFPETLPLAANGSPNAVGTTRGSLSQPRANVHPTVKPVDVMRWLCRLVTPPNGIVLDPFTGSGTTGVAALREGFRFIGIEREDTPEQPYVTIARARIAAADTTPP